MLLFADGLALTHATYRTVAVVCHLGDDPQSFQSCTECVERCMFSMADDGKACASANSDDIREVRNNSYFLCKVGPTHE